MNQRVYDELEESFGFPKVIDDRLLSSESGLKIVHSPNDAKLINNLNKIKYEELSRCPYCGSDFYGVSTYITKTKYYSFTLDETVKIHEFTCDRCGCEYQAEEHWFYSRSIRIEFVCVLFISILLTILIIL